MPIKIFDLPKNNAKADFFCRDLTKTLVTKLCHGAKEFEKGTKLEEINLHGENIKLHNGSFPLDIAWEMAKRFEAFYTVHETKKEHGWYLPFTGEWIICDPDDLYAALYAWLKSWEAYEEKFTQTKTA